MIWIIFTVMTAAVIAVLLRPILKPGAGGAAEDRNAYDRAIFRDQLAELDRDAARGAIAAGEADAARNEISRRLIAVTAAMPQALPLRSPLLVLLSALIVPAVAVPLYLQAGNPWAPDTPLAERLAMAEQTGDMVALVAKVERHLALNPDDLAGWQVIAPVYRRAGRWSELAEALRNINRLSTPSAGGMADQGEAMVLANRGVVSADAGKLFAAALALDPQVPKARFFAALGLKQEGRTEEAKAAFERFLAESPAGAPWRDTVVAEMRDLASRPPALDQQTVEDAAGMSPEDRQAMIRSMVNGLEEKLKADGGDLDGWLRLIRARGVLGETERAKAAYVQATGRFKGDTGALAALAGLAKEMGME